MKLRVCALFENPKIQKSTYNAEYELNLFQPIAECLHATESVIFIFFILFSFDFLQLRFKNNKKY